jgi:ATPase family associated with various cellular activities (AAA)
MLMGLSQVGKTSLAAAMAKYWKSQGFTVWYMNLRAVELSELEAIADHSIVCDVKRMTPQERSGKLREAIVLMKDLENHSKTILIMDEVSPWFTSGTVFDDCLEALMGAIAEHSFDGLKLKNGILMMGTIPPDLPKQKEVKLSQIEIMPIFCDTIAFPDGSKVEMEEKDVTALLKFGMIDTSKVGIPDENSKRAIFSAGEWFGIDHLNTYRENTIRPAVAAQPIAVAPSFQTPQVESSRPTSWEPVKPHYTGGASFSPQPQPAARPVRSFDDVQEFDTPVRPRASRSTAVGNPGIRQPQPPVQTPPETDDDYCDF